MSTTDSPNIKTSNNNFDIVRLILALVVVFSLGVPFCIIFPPYNSNSYLKTFVKIPVF